MSAPNSIDRSFGRDIVWNMASLGFLAAAGLMLNFVVASAYGPEVLGLFNIVMAIYIFLSQIGVFGIHFSILKYVSEYNLVDGQRVRAAVTGAVVLATCVSTFVVFTAVLCTPLVEAAYPFDGIKTAWLAVLPGLWCFSLNKVLLAVVNGMERMRSFAILQALRYVFVLLALMAFLALRLEAAWITVVMSVGELLLLPVLFIYVTRVVGRWDWWNGLSWCKTHLSFGARVFLSGTIGELNGRVDVLFIGSILDSKRAGIYSIALLLAEGYAQAIVVMRANLNPLITRQLSGGAADELAQFGRRVCAWFALFMLVLGSLLVAGFAAVVNFILPSGTFGEAIVPLAILVAGLVVASPYLPFGMVLTQAGRPFEQTVLAVIILGINVLANLLFVPFLGINGAAVGTAISYVSTALLLVMILRFCFGVRLWF
ncbi:MAG: oligosaccharide flippase family protein [Hyphomicrobiaceae bacterium]